MCTARRGNNARQSWASVGGENPSRRKTNVVTGFMLTGFVLPVVFTSGQQASAQVDGTAAPSSGVVGPDLIIGEIHNTSSYGSEGGISAFSLGNITCNAGDAAASYISNTNQHPVVAQHLYRLLNNRIEQLGVSWIAHRFATAAGNACSLGCQNVGSSALGPGCSDPASAGIEGSQVLLSPRRDISAYTGYFSIRRLSCDACGPLERRLQVHDVDLDPALNEGALYFAEVQVISPDDALAGHGENNASYRQVTIGLSTGTNDSNDPCRSTGIEVGEYCAKLSFLYQTHRERAAIRAWRDHDPSVVETDVRVPGEGLFILAAKSIDLGGGVWEYEYALQNINSDRACGSFAIPVLAATSVDQVGFHDVEYHSGDPVDADDWNSTRTELGLVWTTTPYDLDPDANALRWGTLYNFRFRANVPPEGTTVRLGLFEPGSDESVLAQTIGPAFDEGDEDCVPDLIDLCLLSDGSGCCSCPALVTCCFGCDGPCISDWVPAACIDAGGVPDCRPFDCVAGCRMADVDGDFDRDGDRDLRDFSVLMSCYTGAICGSGLGMTSETCRARYDFDFNGDVSLADLIAFHAGVTGP